MKNIYEIGLHDITKIDECLSITRVPGGWIYEYRYPQANVLQVVFVPFNNEFMGKEKTK